jgi:hypothetical protein
MYGALAQPAKKTEMKIAKRERTRRIEGIQQSFGKGAFSTHSFLSDGNSHGYRNR